jgi:hypothetical protein
MIIHAQALAVIPVVAACSVYTGWVLLPATLRRKIATLLARSRWIGRLPAIARAASEPVGCGCDGCDRSASGPGAERGESVIRIVPRRHAP